MCREQPNLQMGEVLKRAKHNLSVARIGDHMGFYSHADIDVLFDFVEQVRDSDVTHDEIVRLQVATLHGGLLSKEDRLMVSRTLGVLASILTDARE